MASSSRDINMPVLATLSAATAILIFVIIVATQAWFRYEYNQEYKRKVIDQPDVQLEHLRAEERAHLQSGPIPIDQAMKQVIEHYAQANGAGSQG